MGDAQLVHVNKQDNLTLLRRKHKTRWDENLKPCNSLFKIDIKNLSRRSRWGADYEKTFTPIACTNIPDGLDVDEFEILISKFL